MSQAKLSLSPSELETLVRRLVREELARLLQQPVHSILDDWTQEGTEDPAEDELLVSEALEAIRKYGNKPEAWISWQDLETC